MIQWWKNKPFFMAFFKWAWQKVKVPSHPWASRSTLTLIRPLKWGTHGHWTPSGSKNTSRQSWTIGAQGCDSFFTVCHTHLKKAILHHRRCKKLFVFSTSVHTVVANWDETAVKLKCRKNHWEYENKQYTIEKSIENANRNAKKISNFSKFVFGKSSFFKFETSQYFWMKLSGRLPHWYSLKMKV